MLGAVKIRFLHNWGRYTKGDEIWPPAGMREELIRRRIAERVIEDDTPETTMLEPQVERAVRPRGRPRKDGMPPQPRKRGRPRKVAVE